MNFYIAPKARADIVGIADWSEENFGPRTAKRYAKLLETAIEDVVADPELIGSAKSDELAQGCRTYHIHGSRNRAAFRGARIRQPRHILVYRVKDDCVEIGRVLHDSMVLLDHLPVEYRRESK